MSGSVTGRSGRLPFRRLPPRPGHTLSHHLYAKGFVVSVTRVECPRRSIDPDRHWEPASSPNRPTGPSPPSSATRSSSSPPPKAPIPGRDFFPLTCEYREKTYAAGKFPGGFIKRETRPSTKETLTSRLMDRPIRPLFPVGVRQRSPSPGHRPVVGQGKRPRRARPHRRVRGFAPLENPVHQADRRGPRRPRQGRSWSLIPTHTQMEESDLDLIVAATRDAVVHDRRLRPRTLRSRSSATPS